MWPTFIVYTANKFTIFIITQKKYEIILKLLLCCSSPRPPGLCSVSRSSAIRVVLHVSESRLFKRHLLYNGLVSEYI